jgi:hypothetical protein
VMWEMNKAASVRNGPAFNGRQRKFASDHRNRAAQAQEPLYTLCGFELGKGHRPVSSMRRIPSRLNAVALRSASARLRWGVAVEYTWSTSFCLSNVFNPGTNGTSWKTVSMAAQSNVMPPIDTEKDQYPRTRRWAEAIHTACPTVEGLCWVSRQDDRGLAIVLFGDRVGPHDLVAAGGPRSVLGAVEVYSDLLALAERIGANVVGGR